jgi:threonine dehydrogenase-like Zn-dependent dehydrogenase
MPTPSKTTSNPPGGTRPPESYLAGMSKQDAFDVVVIGSGLVGLTAAALGTWSSRCSEAHVKSPVREALMAALMEFGVEPAERKRIVVRPTA